ncbi:MAG TPA: hypothetical protein DCQ28_14290 [Bacteroidetes bacterium]|nr:hypothetical protein [Bacteroidota bacterium]
MKSNITKIVTVLFLIASTMPAQKFVSNVSKRGTTAAPFLSIAQGARALGMGTAFVAVANDQSAMYWNPAGIADLTGTRIVFDYTQWIADIKYNYVGATINLGDIGVVGLNLTSSSVPEMRVTTVDKPEGTGEMFGVSDAAVGITYALKLTDKFSIGFNPKFVYQKIWKMSASAIAIDMGVKYQTPFDGITLGMSISNFGSKMRLMGNNTLVLYDPDQFTTGNNAHIPADARTDEWTLPLNFKVGIAYNVFSVDGNRLVLAMDASHPSDNYESIDLGGEYVFNDYIFLRGGYKSLFLENAEERFTLGFGIQQALIGNTQLTFDYAYQDYQRLNNAQKFSVGIIF